MVLGNEAMAVKIMLSTKKNIVKDENIADEIHHFSATGINIDKAPSIAVATGSIKAILASADCIQCNCLDRHFSR